MADTWTSGCSSNLSLVGLNPELNIFLVTVFSATLLGHSFFQFADVFGLSFCFALVNMLFCLIIMSSFINVIARQVICSY